MIRSTSFNIALENFSKRIAGSCAYLVDITSGLMISSAISSLLLVDTNAYPLRVLTPLEVDSQLIKDSISSIQKHYGKNYEKLSDKERIQLKYYQSDNVLFISATVLKRDNGLNMLIVYVVPRRSFIGRYVGFVSTALVISAIVGIIGAIVGIVISVLVSLPLAKLVKQMSYLETMQLHEVREYPVSSLSEIATIQATFYVVVSRLKEYKAFLPSYVLARDFGQDNSEKDTATDIQRMGTGTSFTESILSSSRRSSTASDISGAKFDTSFNLGLAVSKTTILTVNISLDMSKFLPMEIVTQHGLLLRAVEIAGGNTHATLIHFDEHSFILFWYDSSKSNKLAIQCAFTIRDNFNKLQKRLEKENQDLMNMSITIGIDSSENYSGNIGTKVKRQFVTFGTCSNNSRELCLLNKTWGTDILISEAVLSYSILESFITRPIGTFTIDRNNIVVHQVTDKRHIHSDEWMYEVCIHN
jgi:hypothetical protein